MSVRRSFVLVSVSALLLGVTAVPALALAGPGSPDPSFAGGHVVTSFPGSGYLYAAAMDGKSIVGAGYTINGSKDMAAVRYLPSGAPDSTFSGDGRATVHFNDNGAQASDLQVLPDGRSLLVGNASAGGADVFALAMLKPNGTLDKSFGGDGTVTTAFPNFGAYAYSALVLPNGEIIAGGELYRSSDNDGNFALARYLPSGKLDTSFGNHGRVVTNIESSDDGIWSLALQDDGKIVAAGWSSPTSGDYNTAVARYLPSGKLDKTFSGDGKFVLDATPTNSDYSLGVGIRGNGNIVVGIHADSDPFQILQLTGRGKVDTTFGGGDGVVVAPITFSLNGLALQDDGKIIVSGNYGGDLATFRMNKDGSQDDGYGSSGLGSVGVASVGNRVVIDGKGRAVVVGGIAGQGLVARFLG